MPTGLSGSAVNSNAARELIQILHFSNGFVSEAEKVSWVDIVGPENYGVAPDFACGYASYFPGWTGVPVNQDGVFFVNKKSTEELAGFFLAIIIRNGFVVLEAFDTWLHPTVKFEQFQEHVSRDNPSIQLNSGQENVYTTFNGNRIHFVIRTFPELGNRWFGSRINKIEYGEGDPTDTLKDAGNYDHTRDPYRFLTGTILKSVDKSGDGAVMEIHNPSLGTKITLDWSDFWHPKRISESGEVEEAGNNHEVWVDFAWPGPTEGDFFHPFNTLAAAANAVADGGVIKIQPGTTNERPSIHNKRVRLVAPFGGVTVGVR